MKAGRALSAIEEQIRAELASKRDIIISGDAVKFSAVPEIGMTINGSRGPETFGITDLGKRQLADKLGIPLQYWQRMEKEQRALLETNANTWLWASDVERMYRTLHGQIRAVLSNRFRRIDNYGLMKAVIMPTLGTIPGVRFLSAELTDTKLYVKVVSADVSAEIAPGDKIHPGVVISNSEVGCGSLTVQPLILRPKSRAGFVLAEGRLSKKHIGRVISSEDESSELFKEDTLEADDVALFKKTRDVVSGAISDANIEMAAEKIRRSMGLPIIGSVRAVCRVLAQRYSLNEDEEIGVHVALESWGEMTAFGVANAVAAIAEKADSYDRASELEVIAGDVMMMPAAELDNLVTTEVSPGKAAKVRKPSAPVAVFVPPELALAA